jgi:tRNA G18 (ribose-2'-O)-methylase SpoU
MSTSQHRIVIVEDPDDERLRAFRANDRRLSDRVARRDDAGAGLFVAEGDLVVERALEAGCRPTAALVDSDRTPEITARLLEHCDVFAAGEALRRRVTGFGVVHRIIALFARPARPSATALIGSVDRLVVLEGVDNPVNVGSVVRNAAGLGWDGLVLDHTSADPLARRSLRVAMGTAFSLPHARTSDLPGVLESARRTRGLVTVALDPSPDAIDLDLLRLDTPYALLIGSERNGLSDTIRSGADHRVRIPMHAGVDSLNAAAAASIACYALRR